MLHITSQPIRDHFIELTYLITCIYHHKFISFYYFYWLYLSQSCSIAHSNSLPKPLLTAHPLGVDFDYEMDSSFSSKSSDSNYQRLFLRYLSPNSAYPSAVRQIFLSAAHPSWSNKSLWQFL